MSWRGPKESWDTPDLSGTGPSRGNPAESRRSGLVRPLLSVGSELNSEEMKMTVHARVKNGRLLVDEPTDLPDGTELILVPAAEEGPSSGGGEPVLAMLDRWKSEDVSDEPDWDVSDIEPLALRTH